MNPTFKRECANAVGDAINAWGWALITTLTNARIAIADLDTHGFLITSVEVNNTDAVIYIRHTDQCDSGLWASDVSQWQGRNGLYCQTMVHGVKVRWHERRWPWPAMPVIPAGMPDKFVRNEFGRAQRGAKPEPHGCGEQSSVHGRQTINHDNA